MSYESFALRPARHRFLRSRSGFFLFCSLIISTVVVTFPAKADQSPALVWDFDGAAANSFETEGRVAWVASAIGTGGKAAWLNGVDAFLRAQPSEPDLGSGDFSVCAWIYPADVRQTGIVTKGNRSQGWSLDLLANGAIRLTTSAGQPRGNGSVQTAPGRIVPGQWYHVAASVSRGKPDESFIHINGEPAGTATIQSGNLDAPSPLVVGKGDDGFFAGLVDDIRLYRHALAGNEVRALVDAGLSWLRPKGDAAKPFAGKFDLRRDDVIVFAGGANTVALDDTGFLEALLARSFPDQRLRCRNMAWEGDTVFEQWRILNFAPWPHQFERVGASVIVTAFGQTEALQGRAALGGFVSAYERLLDQFEKRTRRIAIVSPIPFEKAAAPLPDLSERNDDLQKYVQALRDLAHKRQYLFVDLFNPFVDSPAGLTSDGLHLSPAGQWRVAREIVRQLIPSARFEGLDYDAAAGELSKAEVEKLRQAILAKNQLWFDYWRPMNWAFLYGDRVEQPSSRDYRDPRIRWFPVELQRFLPLIKQAERRIDALAQHQPQ